MINGTLVLVAFDPGWGWGGGGLAGDGGMLGGVVMEINPDV